jgi:hypothetical protein
MAKTIQSISKSQYLKGMQCPKALWFYRHRKDLAPEISDNQQALFDAGHEVGELAQTYFKNGIEITEEYYEIAKAIQSTESAIKNGQKVIYEATASSSDGAYSRIDILKKVRGTNAWDMIEVKMSTGVKEYHLNDMSLQRYAFEGAGYTIRKSILMHINNQYVRSGDLEVKELFTLEDCTQIVKSRMATVGDKVKVLIAMLNTLEEPLVEIGNHCYDPFECDYTHHCMQHIPNYSVYNIFGGAKLESLLEKGIFEIEDIPDGFDATERQAIEVQAVKSGEVHVNSEGIREFLEQLEYPLYFLDYETINPAVPLYDNSRPYQQIPFQFSLHIQAEQSGPVEHVEFLHTDAGDPRPDFIAKLIGSCGITGSVVVYNQAFESRINRELGETFPEHAYALSLISERMVDLLVPFRSRMLYHSDMQGSASLKAVLPSFVPDLNYDNLEIGDGGTASSQYLCCAKNTVESDAKVKIYDDLRKYCYQDTLAEVRLIDVLYSHQ